MGSTSKIALSISRDIPFNKLLLSACNVRRVKAGVSIQELADDIARRTLLQSLTVRPVLDADGNETGSYEIPAGGRRYRALELLVKQKRLAKTAPIPCVIRTGGIAEEDSLAENVQRAPLHPLDQFRAFLALREEGQSEEEIAAAFFVSVAVVKQRLKLASVSPKLLEAYAEDGMTLDQLMAFTVSGDHERQEQVWERLQSSYTKEPYVIRRQLTEGAVRASDKRVRFIGEAYEAAGGSVLRDLFQGDDGGWLQDVALVDRLVAERLEREAETVRAEGWKWIEVAPDFPYGHSFGLRQLRGEGQSLSAEQEAEREALQAEYDQLEGEHETVEELPEEIERRLAEIEATLAVFDDQPLTFDPAEIARAGTFISIGPDGRLLVQRGFVRSEDELPVVEAEPEAGVEFRAGAAVDENQQMTSVAMRVDDGGAALQAEPAATEPEEEDGIKPLPDRLLTELSAHRTLALRYTLGGVPHLALVTALHALCLKLFYPYALDSCLDLDAKSVGFGAQAPGLRDAAIAAQLEARHQSLAARLPREAGALWEALLELDGESRLGLFAHCVALTVNAVHEAWNRRPRQLAHADRLAQAVQLDMAVAGWTPTVDSYLGRVTKARILQAVREARGEEAAERIAHLKKGDMAVQAEALLAGFGWVPEPLRTPGGAVEGSFVEGNEGQVFASVTEAELPDIEADSEQPSQTEQPEADASTEAWPVAAE